MQDAVADERPIDGTTGTVATATAGAAVLSIASFGAFAVAGQPWGSINDACFAVTGLLAGVLVWRLRTTTGATLAAAAVVGGVVVAVGSGLVISGTTGWLLAGFVSTLGFGIIGPGITTASGRLAAGGAVSQGIGRLGRWAGWFATLGLTAAIPVALRIDDPATAPWWSWLTMIGWLGGAILIPLWAFRLGRVATRG